MLKLFCRRFSSSKALSIARSASSTQKQFDIDDLYRKDLSVSDEDRLQDLLDESAVGHDLNPLYKDDKWSTSPYVQGTFMETYRDRTAVERVKMDPADTSIILFPGYGSQFPGMARSLESVPPARDLFECASEVVGYDVLKMCNDRSKKNQKKLNEIVHSHIAIVVSSLAHLEHMRERYPAQIHNCIGTAGFGIGEITSLIFAGAFEFEQALHLVQLRAEAIEAASELNKGGMASMIFGPDSKVREACIAAKEWCHKNGYPNADITVSQYMYPKYRILSGTNEALQYIADNLQKFRIRSIRPIKNSLPLHCHLMKPAAKPFTDALEQMTISTPLIRVYSNYDSQPYMSDYHIRRHLPKQLYNPIRWEQTMHKIYSRRQGNRFPKTFTCGPGCALRAILQSNNIKAWRYSTNVGDVRERRILETAEKKAERESMS